jgi:hypothetical protein
MTGGCSVTSSRGAIHDLRGSCATSLTNEGLKDEEIARIIGWFPKNVANIRACYVD